MEKKRINIPEKKNYDRAYELSYRLAADKLGDEAYIRRQCLNSGARYDDAGKTIIVEYLARAYRISLPEVEITLPGTAASDIPMRDKLLILHYFNTAKGTPPTNRLITFHELPEGAVYFPTFAKRSIQPLVDAFGQKPALLLEAGMMFNARRVEHGDIAVVINVFSRVPLTSIVWRGDEEFPPQANILFDANITDYLPTEDITVLSETIAWRLVRRARELAGA